MTTSQQDSRVDQADVLVRQAKADQVRISSLTAQAETDGQLIASLADQALLDRVEIATLRDALISSRQIGAAIGIVMATSKVTQQTAFEMLRTVSQNKNRKLRELADDVIYTGTLIE